VARTIALLLDTHAVCSSGKYRGHAACACAVHTCARSMAVRGTHSIIELFDGTLADERHHPTHASRSHTSSLPTVHRATVATFGTREVAVMPVIKEGEMVKRAIGRKKKAHGELVCWRARLSINTPTSSHSSVPQHPHLVSLLSFGVAEPSQISSPCHTSLHSFGAAELRQISSSPCCVAVLV
jgi:hypothetical protein